MTIREVCQWYVAGASTRYESARRRTLDKLACAIGDKLVADCGPRDLFAFLRRLAGTPECQRVRANMIRPVFRKAHQAGLTPCDPFAFAIIKRKDHPEPSLSDAEFRACLRCSRPHLRRVLVMLRYSTINADKLRALRWNDIDLELNAIEFPKIRDHRFRYCGLNKITAKLLAWMQRNRTRTDYVFLSAHHKPWHGHTLSQQMRLLRRRAGTPPRLRPRTDWTALARLAQEPVTWLVDLLVKPTAKPTLFWDAPKNRQSVAPV